MLRVVNEGIILEDTETAFAITIILITLTQSEKAATEEWIIRLLSMKACSKESLKFRVRH